MEDAKKKENRRVYNHSRREKEDPIVVSNRKRQLRQKLKLQAITHYGGICKCCGEGRLVFLSLDHIDGKGAIHRKITGSGSAFYTWLKKNHYPLGLQVLCFNCNWAKHIDGICPHQHTDC